MDTFAGSVTVLSTAGEYPRGEMVVVRCHRRPVPRYHLEVRNVLLDMPRSDLLDWLLRMLREPPWVPGFRAQLKRDMLAVAVEAAAGPSNPQIHTILTNLANIETQLNTLAAALHRIETALPSPPGPAVGLYVQILEAEMASTTLSVDVTNEEVTANFVDDKGDVTTAPDGTSVAFTSSDPTVVSVGDAVVTADGVSAPLSFNKAGSATLSATAVDASGAAVAGLAAGSADLVLTPGPAAGLEVAVDQAPPVVAPPAV